MTIKKIFSPATSIISLFIIILFSNIVSKSDENYIKYYSKDEGILSIMYHRFNENKYPSTNIKMDIFKEHINIIKNSNFNFHNPRKFEEQFDIPKSKKEILLQKYNELTKQAYELSHSNRTASDQKTKEANDILEQIKLLE